ncbi:MAG: hypothetical protein HBSIN02_06380 [Bacteroidia bacterium]|nr:MAG: hypothetical protein HBSIN02_06380 [Bacteroidia bacterium]
MKRRTHYDVLIPVQYNGTPGEITIHQRHERAHDEQKDPESGLTQNPGVQENIQSHDYDN